MGGARKRTIAVLGIGLVALASALYGLTRMHAPETSRPLAGLEGASPPAAAPEQSSAEPPAESGLADASAGSDVEANPSEEAGNSAQTAAEAGADASLGFDIVRIEPSGEAVTAGVAPPGATVELRANGGVIGSAVAGETGEWVIVPDAPLDAGERLLTLHATGPDGETLASEESVAVGIKDGEAPIVVLDAPGRAGEILQAPDVAGLAPLDRTMTAEAPPSQALPEADRAAPRRETPVDGQSAPAGAAPVVSSGSAPASVEPQEGQSLSVESVEYENAGRLFVSGEASAGARLRIYLNDTFVREARAGDDETFTFDLDVLLPPGNYRVRVDEVEGPDGEVAARVEVPYQRDDTAVASATPSVPAEAPAAPREQQVAIAPQSPLSLPPAAADSGGERQAAPRADRVVPAAPPVPSVPDAGAEAAKPEPARTADAAPSASSPPDAAEGGQPTPDTAGLRGEFALAAIESDASGGAGAAGGDAGSTSNEPQVIVIRRGDNLWRIARQTYGEGMRYTSIYDANFDQIRNPDLIYPDQIFVLPLGQAQTAGN